MAYMRVRTNQLRKGMIVVNDVYSPNGMLIVSAGTPATKDVLSILARHFIEYVMVEYQASAVSTNIPSPEPDVKVSSQQIQEFTKSFQVAETALSQSLKEIVDKDKDLDTSLLLDSLNNIVEKSGNEFSLCDMLLKMKKSAEGLYAHSVNVALLGQVLAQWMNFEKEEIEEVVLTGLLHDVGLLKMTNGKLPPDFSFREELSQKKYGKHTMEGYNLIKDKDISVRVKQAVLTHHERLDGSGFPLKANIANINRISRIIAIVDFYDTMTMKTEGCEALSPFLVLKDLEENGHHKYDSELLMTFISRLANNFVRHKVRLSDGKTGQIVMINKFNLTHPLVQVGSSFIDLSLRKELWITEVLD